jgi:hypothetical protein
MISTEANWDPPGNPDGDNLLFYVGAAGDTYTVYVDGPDPGGLLRCGELTIRDYVTFDLLGGDLEVDTQLFIGSGGGGSAVFRSLTLTNNVPQRADFRAEAAHVSGLSVGAGVDVSINMDVTESSALVQIDLNVTGGGTMTVGGHLFRSTSLEGGSLRVSGPGSRLTANRDLDNIQSSAGLYPIRLEDQGVFAVVGDAGGSSNAAGIHLENGILIAERMAGRPVRGYGLVTLTNPREDLEPELEIFNPMGHVSISEDIPVTGHSMFFSVGAAEFSGLAVLGDRARLESPSGLRLIGGEIRCDAGVGAHADIRGDLLVENGVINVVSGDLQTDDVEGYGVVIGSGPVLAGVNGTVNLDRDLDIGANAATVYSLGPAALGGASTMGGGTLTVANGLQLPSAALLRGHGTVAGAITAAPGSTIQARSGLLVFGDAATFGGFLTEGTVIVESDGVLDLRSASFAALGPLTTLNGGTLLAPNGVVLGTGDNLVGTGAANCRIAAGFGSTIAARGNLALGDAAALDGFSNNGSLAVGSHVVTVNDSNQAVLGSLTTLNGGELAAPNGVLLREGNNIAGSGLISADVTSHGYIYGDLAGLELSGEVTGRGSFGGTVDFTHVYAPGSSPTIAYHEDSTFTDTSTLQIELGGLIAGSQFDKLIAEDLSLDGTLQVTLIDGFVPEIGNTFDIFDFTSLADETFNAIALPELTGRKTWDTSALYTDGLIGVIAMRPGDTDDDRDVDPDDLNTFAAAFGLAGDRWTDFNEDGHVDLTDFALIRANFGVASSPSPGVGAPGTGVPEPATLLLLAGAFQLILKRRRY